MGGRQIIGAMMLGIMLVLLCPGQGAWAATIDKVVAIVNDDIITQYELNKKIKEMTGTSAQELRRNNEQKFLETRHEILELLIDQKLAQKKVQELGIKISEKEVDDAIEKVKKNNQWTQEDLVAKLKHQGITYKKYREEVRADLQRYQLINYAVNSKIVIRDEDLKQYYDKHKDDFTKGGKVHLATIILLAKNPQDEQAMEQLRKEGEEILGRIKRGEDFAALARKFSDGPGAQEGGDLGTFNMAELDPQLREICEGLPKGGVSDLIQRPNGLQILKVIDKEEAKTKPFKDVKDAIYNILYKQAVNKRYNAWIKGLRESAYTKTNF